MTSPQTEPSTRETKPSTLNGVRTDGVFATIAVVREQPELGKFRFRATNRWVRGTHSKSRPERFSGAGAEHAHRHAVEVDADHPAVVVGEDEGPTPVELLLYALASCLTAGIANIAAARGVTLHRVESAVEGDIDLRGIFGITDEVRNGYEAMRIAFRIEGDAPPETLRAIVEQSRRRSAVFDVLTHGTAIDIAVDAG